MSTMLCVVLALALAGTAADPAVVLEIEQFRAKHEADYRRQYVPLAGLFPLRDGVNTAGSAAGRDIELPKSAPAIVGRFVVTNDRVRFEPVGTANITLNGLPVTAAKDVKADDAKDGPDELVVADGVSLWVHMSGDRRTVRVRDLDGETARAFAGFRWFPIDEKYRVTARFIKDPAPRRVRIPNQLGDEEEYTTEGIVEFTLDGQRATLRPMTTRPGRLYFIFRDGTSGKETYETARFLYTDLRPDGTTILDFNQAYNPPCSFNPYTTCPLPPRENRLTVRIPAGERAYAGKLVSP